MVLATIVLKVEGKFDNSDDLDCFVESVKEDPSIICCFPYTVEKENDKSRNEESSELLSSIKEDVSDELCSDRNQNQ